MAYILRSFCCFPEKMACSKPALFRVSSELMCSPMMFANNNDMLIVYDLSATCKTMAAHLKPLRAHYLERKRLLLQVQHQAMLYMLKLKPRLDRMYCYHGSTPLLYATAFFRKKPKVMPSPDVVFDSCEAGVMALPPLRYDVGGATCNHFCLYMDGPTVFGNYRLVVEPLTPHSGRFIVLKQYDPSAKVTQDQWLDYHHGVERVMRVHGKFC